MNTCTMTSAIELSTHAALVPLLCGCNLAKRFGQTEALRGADIAIEPGEIVAIMGPSGSGKSTLMHCLAGIQRPDAGLVTYADIDIWSLSERERSRLRLTEFGFVFQFGQLVPDLPAIENVALPLLLRSEPRREAMAKAGGWLDVLGLTGKGAKLPGELAGGEAQRVALARAFAIEPRVIFADEPTGSLDSLASEAVMELLTAAARERGVTVVLVTHDVRIAAYADRELVVRDGRIAASECKS